VVPSEAPGGKRALGAELECDAAEDECRQDQEQRKVEAAEQRRIPVREGRESGATGYEQPHLVAVPDRADRVDQHAAVEVVAAQHSEQDADTEVEPFQHEVARPQDGDDDEPEHLEAAVGRLDAGEGEGHRSSFTQ
jgi:hypothetical protein